MVLVLQVLAVWVVLAVGAAAAVSLLLGRADRLALRAPQLQVPDEAPVALSA